MGLVDLNTIHNPAVGLVPTVAWGDQIRDNFEFLASVPQFSCSTTPGSGVAVANNVITALSLQVENYDTDNMHTGTNNYVTIQTAGQWQFTATVAWIDNAFTGGNRFMDFYKQYPTTVQSPVVQCAGATNGYNTQLNGTRTLACSVGDQYQVRARHLAYAGNISIEVLEFQGRWIGR